jgi:DNA (cytosine-5)-methyltransferase 1
MNDKKIKKRLRIVDDDVAAAAAATPEKKAYKFIDLFCGIGGFHQALIRFNASNATFECVFACDSDEKCREVYSKNYGLKPHGDITKINIANDIPAFDILCAGFPCQSFSNSGKKKAFDDPRGNLFEYILQIASAKRPSFLFLENVKHIKKISDGKVFAHILKRINETGYTISEEKLVFELSPHQLGIPQQRERLIFVCIRTDLYAATKEIHIVPPPNMKIDMTRILEDGNKVDKKYKISNETEQVLEAWDEMVNAFDVGETLSPTIMCNEFYKKYSISEFAALPAWKKDYITKNKPLYEKYKKRWDEWYTDHHAIMQKKEVFGKLEWQVGKKKDTQDSIFNYFIQIRQSGIRVKKAHYFPTLVAIVQTPIYAKERRYITPRECARLQSFPDTFQMHSNDHTAYKQFGNAVNVDVVHFIMKEVLKVYGLIQ